MKHNMRYNKRIKIFALVLAAALSLSACSQPSQSGSSAAESQAAAPGGNSAASANTAAASNASVSSADSIVFSEAFSDRDLSGEYDAGEAVTVLLNETGAEASSDAVQSEDGAVTLTAAGTYILSGTLNGSVIVNVGKEDKVQLVLNNVSIRSETFAAIYVVQADKVFVTLAEASVNTLENGGQFVQIDDNKVDGVIFSKDDLTLNGTGSLTVNSPAGHGIVGKDEVTLTGGTYQISANKHAIAGKDSIAIAGGSFVLKAGKDGLHAENNDDETKGSLYIADGSFEITVTDDAIHAQTMLQIDGGSFEITAAEGLEATYIRINGGDIRIAASDDGVNAAKKSSVYTPTFEMNGGTLTVRMGAGDTDGIDSNGNIVINGGTISVTGNSAFDYDGTAQFNGGTIIVNGQQLSSIPNQMMGGFGGMGGGMPNGGMPNGGMPDGSMPDGGMNGGMPGGGKHR